MQIQKRVIDTFCVYNFYIVFILYIFPYHKVCFMKRLDKLDWFLAALSILDKESFSKITIDNLCSKLNVTKGSFYHHFGNIEGFIDAFMAYILEKKALDYMKKADKEQNLEKRLDLIRLMGFVSDYNVAHKIRAWSYSNEIVKKYLDQIDEIRLEYLVRLRVLKGESKEDAEIKSRIDYALLVGLQQLYPKLSRNELDKLYRVYKE